MDIDKLKSAIDLVKDEMSPVVEKLGQGAEFSYSIFKKQAYAVAFADLIWLIPGVIMAWLTVFLTKQAISRNGDSTLLALTIPMGIAALSCLLIPIYQLIITIVNPDYQAIQLIINTFKTK